MTPQYQYVPAKTHHLVHFLLTLLTAGLWSPVWFLAWLHNHNRMVPRLLPSAPASYAPHPDWQHHPAWQPTPPAPPQ